MAYQTANKTNNQNYNLNPIFFIQPSVHSKTLTIYTMQRSVLGMTHILYFKRSHRVEWADVNIKVVHTKVPIKQIKIKTVCTGKEISNIYSLARFYEQ